jgi:hypothetical protein
MSWEIKLSPCLSWGVLNPKPQRRQLHHQANNFPPLHPFRGKQLRRHGNCLCQCYGSGGPIHNVVLA